MVWQNLYGDGIELSKAGFAFVEVPVGNSCFFSGFGAKNTTGATPGTRSPAGRLTCSPESSPTRPPARREDGFGGTATGIWGSTWPRRESSLSTPETRRGGAASTGTRSTNCSFQEVSLYSKGTSGQIFFNGIWGKTLSFFPFP